MGKEFTNKTWINIIAWVLTIILSILNIYLIIETFNEFYNLIDLKTHLLSKIRRCVLSIGAYLN